MEKNILKNNKIYYMIVAIIVAIFMIILLDLFPKSDESMPPNSDLVNEEKTIHREMSKEDILEKNLCDILTKIDGVDSVDVMITLETSEQIEPAFNKVKSTEVSEENDSSGGRRVVTTENSTHTIVTQNNKDKSEPVLLKSIEPQIKGVLIVASGAEDLVVKERLFEAAKTVLQISVNKIQVYPKKQ